jgi:hypothetical protein
MDQTLIIVIVVGSIALSFILPRVLMPLFTGAAKRKKLIASGVSARAVITSLDQTGTYINEQPKCRIGLRVEPEQGPPFDTAAVQVVMLTQIPQFQPGQVVTVRYDPNNPGEVAIEAFGHVAVSEAKAQRMINEGQALFARLNGSPSAVSALAIVKAFKPTGVTVNGNNPLAELQLKVLPSGEAPFEASLAAVFGVQGLHKYQPGQEVQVRYEPGDRSKVTIDGSWAQAER